MSSPTLLRLLASYNSAANRSLRDILADRPELAAEPGTTWYGSVLTMLSHLVISDTVWLRRTRPERIERAHVLNITFTSVGDSLFDDLPSWDAHRSSLDAVIESVVSEITVDEADEEIRYSTTRGEEFAQPRWQLLLHMFNHQTHHRGGIAQLLDERGVANDLSNLVWYLRDGTVGT